MSLVGTLSRSLGQTIISGQGDHHFEPNHANDSYYQKLRAEAEQAQNQRQKYSAQSQQAWQQGDKSEASRLSAKSKQFGVQADQLNEEAAQWVFRANNVDSKPDEIDLHGLFVHEALSAVDARVYAASQRGEDHVRVIVGKGLHSQGHVGKLKPAVEDYCKTRGLASHVDPHNAGVIVVSLRQGQTPFHQTSFQESQNLQGQQQSYSHNTYQQQSQNQGGFMSAVQQELPPNLRRRVSMLRKIWRLLQQCFG